MNKSHIREIRAFNRFYTSIIGLLDKYVYNSHLSLPEVRVLFELNHHERLTSREIISLFSIDPGFLSRILRDFEKRKFIAKSKSKQDGRATYVSITPLGKKEFKILDEAANQDIAQILKELTHTECEKLIRNMEEIRDILSSAEQKNKMN